MKAQFEIKERFDMIIEHLEKRGSDIDKLTIKEMKNNFIK